MQTWKTTKVPEVWSESVPSVKRLMPHWKHVLMTDEDNREFVKEHFPDFIDTFDAFPYAIQRADAIRACWLYIHGGVYLDLDFVVQKNLDSLFLRSDENKEEESNHLYLVRSGNVRSVWTNSFMASSAKHPFWLKLIDHMKEGRLPFWSFGRHWTVMNSTGPLALTYVLKKNKETTYVDLPSDKVMPASSAEVRNGTFKVNPSHFLRPLKGGSWNSWDSKLWNSVNENLGVNGGICVTLSVATLILAGLGAFWIYV